MFYSSFQISGGSNLLFLLPSHYTELNRSCQLPPVPVVALQGPHGRAPREGGTGGSVLLPGGCCSLPFLPPSAVLGLRADPAEVELGSFLALMCQVTFQRCLFPEQILVQLQGGGLGLAF